MDKVQFGTHYSLGYVFICALVAFAYAFFLYSKKSDWGKKVNLSLSAVRFTLVFILCFLFLEPFFKYVQSYFEKPIVAVLVDNSSSVALADSTLPQQIIDQVTLFKKKATDNNIDVQVFDVNGILQSNLSSFSFNQESTDLTFGIQSIENELKSKNISSILMLSDGIVNQGLSPRYQYFKSSVYTIGVGDESSKRDVFINQVKANKLAYKGNSFPVRITTQFVKAKGEQVTLKLFYKDSLLAKEIINVVSDDFSYQSELLVNFNEIGKKQIRMVLDSIPKELTYINNHHELYVNVVEEKEKILLLAAVPHPDLKFLKQSLLVKEKYEIDLVILSLGQKLDSKQKYSAALLHQIPNINSKDKSIVLDLKKKKIPLVFFVGAQTDIQLFNELNGLVKIKGDYTNTDDVVPLVNQGFKRFLLAEDPWKLKSSPPVRVPFAKYEVTNSADVISFQKIGNIQTDKPLMIAGLSNSEKEAVIIGDGYWRYFLESSYEKDDQSLLYDVYLKTIGFVSEKKDQRKFVVNPLDPTITESLPAEFIIKTFNDIYEPVFENEVNIRITGDSVSRNYSFVTGSNIQKYTTEKFLPGTYQYLASTTYNGQKFSDKGEFVVQEVFLEGKELTANFGLLKMLAEHNDGDFAPIDSADRILNQILENKKKAVMHSNVLEEQVLSIKWLLILIVLLASIEWLGRKMYGSY